MGKYWNRTQEATAIDWGGRIWRLGLDDARPGLVVRLGESILGPLLALDALAARGRTDRDAFGDVTRRETSVDDHRVRLTQTFANWPGLVVHAIWEPTESDAIDLEARVALAANAPNPLEAFELRIASILPEPGGSRIRRWVEPRDRLAAASSYDGREGDVHDLTTLPPDRDGRLAPRVIPSPWDDGLCYVEMARHGQVARRVVESRKPSSVGRVTRYGLLGVDLEPGSDFTARIRGAWILSVDPQREALERAQAFDAGATP